MLSTAQGRFYIATCQPTDAQAAVTRWLTTGLLRVSDPAAIKIRKVDFMYLPFCQVECNYIAEWSADIGEIDQGALSVAWNQYRMAEAHYFSLSEQQRKWARGPIRPKEADFIQWSHRFGTERGEWRSGALMAAVSRHPDARVTAWAIELRSKMVIPATSIWSSDFGSWSQHAGAAGDHLLEPQTDEEMFTRCLGQITNAITESFRAKLPRYHRNAQVRLATEASHFQTSSWAILPIYFVAYEVDQKHGVCIVDAISATIVIGVKVRDVKGAVGRFFEPVASMFKKQSGPPKLIGYEARTSDDASEADLPVHQEPVQPQPLPERRPHTAVSSAVSDDLKTRWDATLSSLRDATIAGFWQTFGLHGLGAAARDRLMLMVCLAL